MEMKKILPSRFPEPFLCFRQPSDLQQISHINKKVTLASQLSPFFSLASLLHSSVPCGHLYEALGRLHDLVGGEGLLHLPVLVHLMDALRHRDGHLLGRHPIVLPFCLVMMEKYQQEIEV